MRKTCIWLTVSTVLTLLGWHTDQARSQTCAVSCYATTCLQKKDDQNVLCLTNVIYYGEMNHPNTPTNCHQMAVTYDTKTTTCSSPCSNWNGSTTRIATGCGMLGGAETVDGCLTCYGPSS